MRCRSDRRSRSAVREAPLCGSRRCTTSTATCPRSRRCWPRSRRPRRTSWSSAGTSSPAALPAETLDRLARARRPRPLGDGQRRPHGHRGLRPRRPPGGPRGRDRPPRRLGRAAAHAGAQRDRLARVSEPLRARGRDAALPRLTRSDEEIHHRGQLRRAARPDPRRVTRGAWSAVHTHHQFDRRRPAGRAQRRQRRMPYEDIRRLLALARPARRTDLQPGPTSACRADGLRVERRCSRAASPPRSS